MNNRPRHRVTCNVAEGNAASLGTNLMAWWDGLADRLTALTGWRRYGVAALCGALSTLAMPPFSLSPLLVPAFCGFYWLSLGARTRWQGFAIGWCFGWLHFATGLYWITNALLVDAATFGWLAPFAVSGLSAGLAIFTGLIGVVFYMAQRHGFGRGWAGPLLLALLWTAAEWLRGHILTGFPWNLLATTWSFSPVMSQSVALFGAYGLSFVTALAALAPAVATDSRPESGGARHDNPRRRTIGLLAFAAPLALCAIAGVVRLAPVPEVAATVPDVRLRLVQANIDQRLKWAETERLNTLRKYLALSGQVGAAPVTHVVWPETALPYFLSTDGELLRIVSEIVPPGGLLLTGAVRTGAPGEWPAPVWNSLHGIDDGGRIVATYDKVHLVPFGEYVPLRQILPFDKITPGASDFSAGPGPRTLVLPGLPPVSPSICYEALFPGVLVAAGEPQAQWLLNVTNDAWFGHSAGPHQHFASARLRTIEQGLPLVRAANTGISAVVDPYGRIVAQLGLGREGVLDSALPRALPAPPYARWGDLTLLALFLAAFVLLLAGRAGRQHTRDTARRGG